MTLFPNDANCYYAQILDCKNTIPGFYLFAQLLTVIAWLSVVLGLVDVGLSVWLKRAKAATRGSRVPGLLDFSKFEYFLLCFTVVGLISGVAMSLTTFVNISSKLFYALMGTRNVIMFIAIMVYVDMVLQTNSFQNRVLERLRTLYLRLLLIPVGITFGMFNYQGYMSDYTHYEDTSLAAERRFNLVVALAAVMWQLSFVLLLVFIIIARRTFTRYLTDVILPEIEREKSSTGWNSQSGGDSGGKGSTNSWTASKNKKKLSTSMPAGGGGSGGKKFKPKSTAMASALRSGIITLRWLGFGVMVFILYSLFFTLAILYIGTPFPVYFFTLFINWSTPFVFGFIVFIVVFVRSVNQIRDHQEQQQEDEEEARSPSDVALPYSLPSNNSNHSYPPPIQQIATLPTTNPIQAFYNPSLSEYPSNVPSRPMVINTGARRDRFEPADPEIHFTTSPPVNSNPSYARFK